LRQVTVNPANPNIPDGRVKEINIAIHYFDISRAYGMNAGMPTHGFYNRTMRVTIYLGYSIIHSFIS